MNKFLKSDLAWSRSKCPGFNTAVLKDRFKNIQWPVWKKACVCEVTINSACNSKCRFCYIPPGVEAHTADASFEAVCRALYTGRRKGAWLAAVIGGEPTLRADAGRIAAFARKAGYACVKLCTNGLALADRNYAAHMAESGFNMIDISLHGIRPEIHDALVGVPGAFKKVMRAMDNVKSLGLELGTNQVVNRLNYITFPDFFHFALRDLGINCFNIIYSNYRGMMALNADDLKVKVSLVAPYIKLGLREYEDGGFPAFSRVLVNFQPCLLPEYRHLMADWRVSSEQTGEYLLLPDGQSVNMHSMKDKQKRKPRKCASCVIFSHCRGIDRDYLELFGGLEFKPLKRLPPLAKVKLFL